MENEYQTIFPVLPLRDVVVFPNLIMPLFVGRAKSVKALEAAEKAGGRILLVAQKAAEKDDPGEADLFTVGCVAGVLQTLRLPDNTVKVLVEGGERAIVEKWNFADGESPLTAQIQRPPAVDVGEAEALALARAIKENLKSYGKAARRPPDWDQIMAIEGLAQLTDAVAAHFPLENAERQKLLEDFSAQSRAEKLLALIARETESQKIERKIKGRVKDQIEKSHREYYLNEQAKAIARELGEDSAADIDALKKRVKNAGMSEQARKKCEQEMRKLGMMSSMSAEATVARTYVETLLDLPWQKRGEMKNDIPAARKILDEDHYALEKVKERILEYLAIQKRVKNGKAPILCLVGPPGVGKTSLGRSIARATGRRFARISVGGVRDEAEVRGHRRTYVGSMPGKIITTMTRAGVKNPLVLLDEIDKMGYDFRGDPAAALLEVLDPEQNRAFVDHYVEVDYDLSEVMFVTTANTLRIPPPLLDRLEIIRLSGYTEDEKINIAENYLRPRQFVENGVREGELKIQRPALRDMVRHYTREAGVRELERLVSKVCRKAVLEFETRGDEAARAKARAKRKAESADEAAAPVEVEKPTKPIAVTAKALGKFLGARRYRFGVAAEEAKVGQVTGLAWTEVGGELLSIEAVRFPGKGAVLRTGKLGEVMRESVEAAFSVVRMRAERFGIEPDFMKESDFHIHLPEGAIPKDGPSAGAGIAVAVLSAATLTPARADTAMTGEITLRGEILPVGGLKEKLLAAARGGIKRVILPTENKKDMEEIADIVKGRFEIFFVKWIDEVFNLALTSAPPPKKAAPKKRAAKPPKPKVAPAPAPEITH